MIKGKKTHLVAFESAHWPYIAKWMGDAAYRYYFRNLPQILNQIEYANFPNLIGMNILMIVESANNEIIGMASWDNVRMLARACDIGFIIDKDFQGKGYTKDAFMHFMNYLISRLGFHKVSAKVASTEFATSGKTIWGGFGEPLVLRDEFFMDGKWQDDILLSVLDHEFKQRFDKYIKGEEAWEAVEKVDRGKLHMINN